MASGSEVEVAGVCVCVIDLWDTDLPAPLRQRPRRFQAPAEREVDQLVVPERDAWHAGGGAVVDVPIEPVRFHIHSLAVFRPLPSFVPRGSCTTYLAHGVCIS